MNAPAWPPLVGIGVIPAWIRVRDLVLTLAAWLLFAWWTRRALLILWDWLRPPFFQMSELAPPDWTSIWLTLAPFFAVAALLGAWLVFWSARRSDVLARRAYDPAQPAPLDNDAHASQFGLAAADAQRLRERAIATVRFDDAGNIVPGQAFTG